MKLLLVGILAVILPAVVIGSMPWVKPSDLNKGLPASIEIFTLSTSSSPFGTKLTGGFVRMNMSDTNLQFKVVHTAPPEKPKTPMQYADAEEKHVYSVINGGFFDMTHNISASFICEQGNVLYKNTINMGSNSNPTVGAFGFDGSSFMAEYVFTYDPISESYKFRVPNPVPGPAPDKSKGQIWKIKEAIGAGPILVKNGYVVSGNVENFNYNNMVNFRHPRSAICIDNEGRLLFVAIDGRYDGSDGATMPEIAEIMLLLDCYDAMNLDGGGSTLLYANGHVINRPSDGTGPRPVVSAVLIRDRNKPKNSLRSE